MSVLPAVFVLAFQFIPPAAAQDTLTVFAASDLQVAFGEIAPAFERATGHKLVLVFGASGALSAQIERGAPADIFFSADQSYIRQLLGKDILFRGSDRVYALGHVVLVSRRASGITLTSFRDIARPDVVRIAIANPEHAPYGRAARDALRAAGLWEALQPRLVFGENIRQTAQFVQTGAVEAAIVSASLAMDSTLAAAPIDESLYAPIIQAAGIVKASGNFRLSLQFLDFVTGEAGWPIMRRYGFSRPTRP